jgi:hypothetical protein
MKQTEHFYIQLGYRFQQGRIKFKTVERAFEAELQEFQILASQLFNRGRQEAMRCI